ncbi:hypothetical protein R3P38DRAFT_3218934 [Favolaschia claudopus]|uniref:Uncharacterized protein n=1 Tax=Favolaschia claudopus TaxID=2862362 RepID=A0AAW0A3I8_9AGAR
MLQAASILRCLQLINVSWSELDKFTHVDMDSVIELHVTNNHWFQARPLDHIHFPKLRILRLSGAVKFHDAVLIFSDFLPHIHRLELAFPECNASPLQKLFVAAANLLELYIFSPSTAAWMCIVQLAREGKLSLLHLRLITVQGVVEEDHALLVLRCAGSGCVLQKTGLEVDARCARWVIGGEGLVEDNGNGDARDQSEDVETNSRLRPLPSLFVIW